MARHHARVVLTVSACLLAAQVFAQNKKEMPPMTPEQKAEMEAHMKAGTPGAQHQDLASMAGTYDLKIKMWHEPGAPAEEETGTATRTMTLDGRVMVEDLNTMMMGAPYTGHGMSGYDNVTGKYWSTWSDTMSTGLLMSEGTCNAQKACTFTATHMNPMTKKPMKLRMTTRRPSPTTEVFEMFGPDKNGKEMKMMEILYTKR